MFVFVFCLVFQILNPSEIRGYMPPQQLSPKHVYWLDVLMGIPSESSHSRIGVILPSPGDTDLLPVKAQAPFVQSKPLKEQ